MAISRYQLGKNDNKSLKSKLLYVTYSKYEHDWPSFPHSHYFTELCYIKKGEGSYLIDGELFPVKKGDFVIINANITHTETSTGSVPLEYIILGVEGLDFSFHENNRHIILDGSRSHTDFSFYMDSLLYEMEEKKEDYELVCQNLLEVLIILLERHTNLTFETVPTEKSSRECTKIKKYIEANYTHNITLDLLSEISCLNKFYLVHTFTKRFGCSPMNYLCEVRINASKELLATTDYSITEIAQSSGFSSQSYFSQCFFKHCHMTASAYRKSCREN